MPPPTAPASKPTDPTDLADALTSAGIDLKEEEARLASGGGHGMSFNVDPYTGALSQEDAHRMEQRMRAQGRAIHTNDPFLNFTVLSNRILNKTHAENCSAFSIADNNQPSHNQNVELITLVSLAARERLKTLLTRSMALAKVRRRPQTHITGEWADCVEGVTPEIRPDGGSAVSPRGGSLKRETSYILSFAENILTANLQNETAKALRALKQKEWEEDQERQRKKAKREEKTGATSGAATPGGETPTPRTPGAETPGPGERKLSTKESRKAQATKQGEAESHRAANMTASLMMGGFGTGFGGKKKKKTYSWMNSGGSSAAQAMGMGMGASRPGPAAVDTNAAGQVSSGPDIGSVNWTGQRIGVWREDGERGKGIQIRDWIGALEGDGRVAKRGIVKAYLRLK
ncbi:transcription initiation factor TFIID component TAF4 [Sphaerosporella brunnea]|uniref:Transcription initiation factor TFIID subunit 4 n=1 Tax=Sphaerosporella brunnea TaxID=1250544 RepID=A0A5J5EC74_9PEZI|nr:transcription initiation factor TFIID component TAF4 [Sphaerosporella brunnea]